MLLISFENGRSLETYGVNRVDVHNMKFTFICIVIVLSCSVCASGNLEIYPDWKFRLHRNTRRQALDYDDGPYPPKTWRFEEGPAEEYVDDRRNDPQFDFAIPANEFGANEKHSYRTRNHKTVDPDLFYSPRQALMNIMERYNKLEKSRNYNHYKVKFPNSQILDDVRPYPNADDFGGEIEVQTDRHPPIRIQKLEKAINKAYANQEKNHENLPQEVVRDYRESSANSPEITIDDPTEFAYIPPDPRYYETSKNPVNDVLPEISPSATSKLSESVDAVSQEKFVVNSRSGDRFENVNVGGEELERLDSSDVVAVQPRNGEKETTGVYIIAIVAGISAAATVGLIAVGIGWYNLHKHVKNASDVEYPAYGVTGPNKDVSPSTDRRLAQSAQMYHYQHQKQQIIAMENRAATSDGQGSVSEGDSEEENEEGDYTVYECPGLAPTGEMEVKNPLFQDDPTPAQTPPVVKPEENKK